jgi:hypothetical protein
MAGTINLLAVLFRGASEEQPRMAQFRWLRGNVGLRKQSLMPGRRKS